VYLADNTRKEGIYADFKIDINDCEELLNLIENGLTQARSGVL
jgi:hypothetical protein